MATPRATYQRKRSRKKSFSGGKKAEVQSLFQAYAQQGLGLVDIMFKLHDTAVDDIPENMLRKWNKGWKIPVQDRDRSPRYDPTTTYPYFKLLYEDDNTYYTIDDIVFILHDHPDLRTDATKSCYQKMLDKWPLQRRYRPRGTNSQGRTPRRQRRSNDSGSIQHQVEDTTAFAYPTHPCGIRENMARDLPSMPMPLDFDSITNEFGCDPANEQEVLINSDGLVIDDLFGYNSYGVNYTEPNSDCFVLVNSNDNEDEDGDSESEEFVNVNHANSDERERPPALQLNSQIRPSQNTYSFTDYALSHNPQIFSSSENRIMWSIHCYLFWLRQDIIFSFGDHGDVSPQRENMEGLPLGHLSAGSFYNTAFNATQSSVSTTSAHHKQADIEWARAKSHSQYAMRHPTARLLVSLLSFYSNAYVQKARGMHKHNFQILCSQARKLLSADNHLTLLLQVLADSDMSNPGTEISAMALLVNILHQYHNFDFDSNYEARELHINVEKNLRNFEVAHNLCDELIAYSEKHAPVSDPAPVRRAWRRKGRIFFAQHEIDLAWETFMSIHAAWVADNSPSRASREYMVFEDLGKICRFRGQFAEAKRWFLLAESLSDLAYASVGEKSRFKDRPSLNSLRIRELVRLMEKAHIGSSQEEQGLADGEGGDSTMTVGSDDHRRDEETGKAKHEDRSYEAEYLGRESARW